jgi:hypothetical protein
MRRSIFSLESSLHFSHLKIEHAHTSVPEPQQHLVLFEQHFIQRCHCVFLEIKAKCQFVQPYVKDGQVRWKAADIKSILVEFLLAKDER